MSTLKFIYAIWNYNNTKNERSLKAHASFGLDTAIERQYQSIMTDTRQVKFRHDIRKNATRISMRHRACNAEKLK